MLRVVAVVRSYIVEYKARQLMRGVDGELAGTAVVLGIKSNKFG